MRGSTNYQGSDLQAPNGHIYIPNSDLDEELNIKIKRIALLEERLDLLNKQNERYENLILFRNDGICNSQARCYLFQQKLEGPYHRIQELEQEYNDSMLENQRLNNLRTNVLRDLSQIQSQKQQKQEVVKVNNGKLGASSNEQYKITVLEEQIKILQFENERLNNLVTSGYLGSCSGQ